MRMQGLSLEVIPPIHIPFRFFLIAPWMGVLAALVLLAGGNHVFSTQWNPALLAATHLLTLGFMAMVMLGAMFQLVPVISGRLIPGGVVVASVVHLSLLLGLLLLAAGFSQQDYALFRWAGPLLLLAFAVFLLALGSLLARPVAGGDSIFSIRFAALALFITVGLGLLRSADYAGLSSSVAVADAGTKHLLWGLGGWAPLLVMGASYQVIPMFHVTPSFPTPLARALPVAVFFSLLTLTFTQAPLAQALAVIVLCGAASLYAAFTLQLINRRKRKVDEITIRFWRLSLASLLLAALLWVGVYFQGDVLSVIVPAHRIHVLIGILMVYGFAISVIMGMLQKIVAFLSFLHLQRRSLADFELLKSLPHMGDFVPPARTQWQFRLHAAALLMLVIAAITSSGATLAALLIALDFAWLGVTLARAAWLYRKTALRISA
jgi:hypothetical protein